MSLLNCNGFGWKKLNTVYKNKPGPAQVGAIGLPSKIAKGLQSGKVVSSRVPEKPKKLDRIDALKGGTVSHFLTSIVVKHQKNEGWENFLCEKKSHNAGKN